MHKRQYLSILVMLLIVVVILIVLQFKYFGRQGYWAIVLVLIMVWVVSKWLSKNIVTSG